MRKGCLIFVIAVLILCLGGCGLLYFVGLPKVRDAARDGFRDAISTQVAIQIPAPAGGTADPGTYTITEQELQAQLLVNVDSDNIDDIVISITPQGFEFGLATAGDQDTTYTGVPVVENGKLRMEDMQTSSDFFDFLFPPKDLAKAIEDGVNNYLEANDLELDSLELEEGQITLVTVAAP
jgi:hypothetical protein